MTHLLAGKIVVDVFPLFRRLPVSQKKLLTLSLLVADLSLSPPSLSLSPSLSLPLVPGVALHTRVLMTTQTHTHEHRHEPAWHAQTHRHAQTRRLDPPRACAHAHPRTPTRAHAPTHVPTCKRTKTHRDAPGHKGGCWQERRRGSPRRPRLRACTHQPPE